MNTRLMSQRGQDLGGTTYYSQKWDSDKILLLSTGNAPPGDGFMRGVERAELITV